MPFTRFAGLAYDKGLEENDKHAVLCVLFADAAGKVTAYPESYLLDSAESLIVAFGDHTHDNVLAQGLRAAHEFRQTSAYILGDTRRQDVADLIYSADGKPAFEGATVKRFTPAHQAGYKTETDDPLTYPLRKRLEQRHAGCAAP